MISIAALASDVVAADSDWSSYKRVVPVAIANEIRVVGATPHLMLRMKGKFFECLSVFHHGFKFLRG